MMQKKIAKKEITAQNPGDFRRPFFPRGFLSRHNGTTDNYTAKEGVFMKEVGKGERDVFLIPHRLPFYTTYHTGSAQCDIKQFTD